MTNIFLIPSFYAHIFNGFLLFVAIILLIFNYSAIKRSDPYKLVMFIFIFSIAVGIHGLSHLGLETVYNFNILYNIKK